MIPKIIHYCWFGEQPLPDIAVKCMESWVKYCPSYKVVRWDESNCDMNSNDFVRQAYARKKWAFVSDYFRLKVIEQYGGIYLDIDVELVKPLDKLCELDGFMGFELGEQKVVNSGLGFGAIANHSIITALRNNYEVGAFVKSDGSLDTEPCPQRDTKVLVGLGLLQNNKMQCVGGVTFFPSDYFSPLGFLGEKNFSENTHSIHHFNASWISERQRKALYRLKKLRRVFGAFLGNKLNLLFLAYDELRCGGFRVLIKKVLQRFRASGN